LTWAVLPQGVDCTPAFVSLLFVDMTDAIVRQDEDRRFLFGGIGETN
jgi:hypothetical protein